MADKNIFYPVHTPEIDEDVENYLGENGYFSANLPYFKFRQGQLDMAKAWQSCLKESNILVSEAGTGTGKTYAYLVPALLSRKKIVISTASKALQDQLVNKDLEDVFSMLNLPPDYMALKGFSNYLCLEKYESVKRSLSQTELAFIVDEKELTDEQMLNDDRHTLHQIFNDNTLRKLDLLIEMSNYEIAMNSPNPSFAEVNSTFSEEVVHKVTRASDTCIGRKCKFYDSCFPFQARARALEVKVLVVNHSLFFSTLGFDDPFDPMSPPILLPKYRAIIFDEAHEMPAIGREHMSLRIGSNDMRKFKEDLKYLSRETSIPKKPFEKRVELLDKAYKEVFEYMSEKEKGEINKRNLLFYKYHDYDPNSKDPYFKYKFPDENFRAVVGNLYKTLKEYEAFIKSNIDCAEDYLSNLQEYVHEKADVIVRIMNIDLDDRQKNPGFGKYVATGEVSRKNFALSLTPLEISELFGDYLDKCQLNSLGVLMTSATLMVAKNFNKFLTDIGAPNDTSCMEVKSSFNYPYQAGIYMSGDFPSTADERRIEGIVNSLRDVLESVEGGIFFLTTSKTAISAARSAISRLFRNRRKIYSQYGNLSNSEMLKRFKEDGRAVLIATSSFWAGVDVPGSALSLLIIDKLPFETPTDPIFNARCMYFDADNNNKQNKKSSFMSIAVPEAIIELRQGVGRLIRHENDRGGLIICDPRIVSARYSGMFKKSLPDMSLCSNLQELQSFLSHDKKLMSLNRICDDVKDEFVNEHEAPGYVHESIPFEESLDDKYDVNVHADNHNSSFKFSNSDVIDADVIEVNDNTQ